MSGEAENEERELDALERFEALIADALCSADPAAELSALAAVGGSDTFLAREFGPRDLDGVRIAALLVARLRFERLLHGSRAAGEDFRADPAAFTARFRRYHTSVVPRATTTAEEAAEFEGWSRVQRGE